MADELLDMAGGNRRSADLLRRNLTDLADSDNGKLGEMAQAVLEGASLRELALSDTYGAEIGPAFGAFWDHYRAMSSEDRAELERRGADALRGDNEGAAGPRSG